MARRICDAARWMRSSDDVNASMPVRHDGSTVTVYEITSSQRRTLTAKKRPGANQRQAFFRLRRQSRTFLLVGCDDHVLRVAAAIHKQQQRLVRSATNGRPELLHIVNGLAVHFLDDVAPL